jgi:hypothetical protein
MKTIMSAGKEPSGTGAKLFTLGERSWRLLPMIFVPLVLAIIAVLAIESSSV